MKKNKFFSIKTLISFIVSIILISMAGIVIASPDLEKDIKEDLSIYLNHLNNGDVSGYYDIYNTRKLSDMEKLSFYDKIKNSTKVMNAEMETFKKFKLKIKISNVDILRRLNNNTYLCNVGIEYRLRENTNTTKTIKKTEDYILKIIYIESKDEYKILLPFNSLDKDFSQSNIFAYLENLYKTNKAKEIEEQRLLEDSDVIIDNLDEDFIDESNLESDLNNESPNENASDESNLNENTSDKKNNSEENNNFTDSNDINNENTNENNSNNN